MYINTGYQRFSSMRAQVSVNHGFHPGLKILRILDRQRASVIELLPFFRREVPIARTQILLKLRQIARSDDRRGDAGHGKQPRDCHLAQGFSQTSGSLLNGAEDLVIPFGEKPLHPSAHGGIRVRQARRLWGALSGAILAAQEAAAQRAPGNNANAFGAAERQDLALDRPAHQAVLRLEAIEAGVTVQRRHPERFGQLPGAKVRAPEVTNFSLLYQRVERRKGFLQRRV